MGTPRLFSFQQGATKHKSLQDAQVIYLGLSCSHGIVSCIEDLECGDVVGLHLGVVSMSLHTKCITRRLQPNKARQSSSREVNFCAINERRNIIFRRTRLALIRRFGGLRPHTIFRTSICSVPHVASTTTGHANDSAGAPYPLNVNAEPCSYCIAVNHCIIHLRGYSGLCDIYCSRRTCVGPEI